MIRKYRPLKLDSIMNHRMCDTFIFLVHFLLLPYNLILSNNTVSSVNFLFNRDTYISTALYGTMEAHLNLLQWNCLNSTFSITFPLKTLLIRNVVLKLKFLFEIEFHLDRIPSSMLQFILAFFHVVFLN